MRRLVQFPKPLRFLVTIVLCVLSSGIFAQGVATGSNVSLINLIATPERYDGQLVYITGYVTIRLEDMSVCQSKDTLSRKDCLWLSIDDGAYKTESDVARFESKERTWKQFDGKAVSIRGIFDKNNKGHLGMWAGSIRNIVDVYGDNKHLSFKPGARKAQ